MILVKQVFIVMVVGAHLLVQIAGRETFLNGLYRIGAKTAGQAVHQGRPFDDFDFLGREQHHEKCQQKRHQIRKRDKPNRAFSGVG